jgi:murein endopeptidase
MGTAYPDPVAPALGAVEPLDLEPRFTFDAPIVPRAAEPVIELDKVRWTVPTTMKVLDLAKQWGVRTKMLAELNPTLQGSKRVGAGQQLVVYDRAVSPAPQSVGAPNRGRLLGGVPLPEGDHWTVRDHRNQIWGTRYTVEALLMAFDAYGREHPDGPSIRLGDISFRRGGRISPHVSHRTGRDVDIGYVTVPDQLKDRYWQNANAESFDVERNWTLVRALIETGRVQQIFMSVRLQKLLLERAKQDLTPEQLADYFRIANADHHERSIIKHWKGHRNHMHVRFRCEPGNSRCRARG